MKKTAGYTVVERIPAGIPFETQVIIHNGAETQLRVTLNNSSSGLVEVEFHEVSEPAFRYPLNHI